MRVGALQRANGITNPDRFFVGQTLTIPSGSSTPTTPGTPTTEPLSNAPNQQFTLRG